MNWFQVFFSHLFKSEYSLAILVRACAVPKNHLSAVAKRLHLSDSMSRVWLESFFACTIRLPVLLQCSWRLDCSWSLIPSNLKGVHPMTYDDRRYHSPMVWSGHAEANISFFASSLMLFTIGCSCRSLAFFCFCSLFHLLDLLSFFSLSCLFA